MNLPSFAYIDTAAAWAACVAHLQQAAQLAIDLESNSLYAYREQICLIQISTRTRDFIVDPLADLDLAPLGALLADPAVEKVFHAAEYDLILMTRGHGWELNNLFDTMWAARILGIERIGLANLLEERFGVELNKKYQRADWCHRPLTAEQLRYAQADTHFLLRLRDELDAELAALGRVEESAEIFLEQSRVKLPDVSFDPDHFWHMNGVSDLNGRQRAVLRELVIFRDRQAQAQNRPLFKVLSDKALLELAERMPEHVGQLAQTRALSHSQVRRYGSGLLDAVTRGKRARPPQRPRHNRRLPDDVVQRYDRLHLWRKEHALQRGVASDVVLSRDALWQLAHANPQTAAELAHSDVLGPWRLRTYGDAILAVLREADAAG